MILFRYTHWFWITILIVYSSVMQTLENKVETTTHSTSNLNVTGNGTVSLDQSASNATKMRENSTSADDPTTLPSTNTNITSMNVGALSAGEHAPSTVIEANATSPMTSDATDDETLTTLETSYREAENESMTALDRIVAIDDAAAESRLSAAGITGITLGCVVLVAIICSVSFLWYRNRGFNRPQVLTDRSSNLDSSGYIDDTSDNSEEMYSLDNDSFLNSLEAMTIQNYWTDTVKHTKL